MWNNSLFKLYYTNREEYNNKLIERQKSENTYNFDFDINGNRAFFFYHKDIMNLITKISFLDKKVSKALENLPKAAYNLYKKKSLIDEILYTNEIEGVISTRKEINEIIETIEKNQKVKPNKILSSINKYLMLEDDKHDYLKSVNDVRKLYDELVLDDIIAYDPKDKPDGVIFRANQVKVLNEYSGKVVHEGVMPESKIIDMVSNMISFLNDESVELIVRVAVFHYVFSYIHPFYDGNGRTNRFISSLYLKTIYNPIISFRLSLTIKENKKQYYDAFEHTNDKNNKGDISTFVYEFIDIVEKAYGKTMEYLNVKTEKLKEANEKINKLKLKDECRKIMWLLAQIEIFKGEKANINFISGFIEKSLPTTRSCLTYLLQNGLIVESKETKYKVYTLNIDL